MGRCDPRAEQVVEVGDQLQQGSAPAARDVVDVAAHRRGVGSLEVSLHHFGDVGEIARLPAVAVDQRTLPGRQRPDEERDDRGVRAVRRLPRAKDVEIAEPYGLQPVDLAEGGTVVLARQLGRGVGRQRQSRVRLVLGQLLRAAVSAGAGRVNEAPHPRVARRQQHLQRAVGASAVRGQRIGDAARHRRQRRLMEHDFAAAHRLAHRFRVRYVAVDDLDPVAYREQVRRVARAEVVQHAHGPAALQQRLNQMGADEARAAGYENVRHGNPPWLW